MRFLHFFWLCKKCWGGVYSKYFRASFFFPFYIIDSHNPDTGKGLPLGNQTSQWFALYYLDPLDRLIKEKYRIKYYTRYMDDLVMIHESKDYLKEVLDGLRGYAEDKLGLEFNEKTQKIEQEKIQDSS